MTFVRSFSLFHVSILVAKEALIKKKNKYEKQKEKAYAYAYLTEKVDTTTE